MSSEVLTVCDTFRTLYINMSSPVCHTLTKFIYRIALNKDYLCVITKFL